MKIKFGNTVLSRGHSDCEEPLNLLIRGNKQLQVCNVIRSKTAKILDRENFRSIVSFTITRQHATKAKAEEFMLTHTSNVCEEKGDLLIDPEDKNSEILYFFNAKLKQIDSNNNGLKSIIKYQFISGDMLKGKL